LYYPLRKSSPYLNMAASNPATEILTFPPASSTRNSCAPPDTRGKVHRLTPCCTLAGLAPVLLLETAAPARLQLAACAWWFPFPGLRLVLPGAGFVTVCSCAGKASCSITTGDWGRLARPFPIEPAARSRAAAAPMSSSACCLCRRTTGSTPPPAAPWW
jgi:hypothetical protein